MSTKQWEEDARTDYETLLKRIKDAYYEGHRDGDHDGYANHVDQCWEASNAKHFHDTIKKLWSEQ